MRGRILKEVWRRGLITQCKERKQIIGERREEMVGDERKTGELSIHYNMVATTDSHWDHV